MKPIIFYISVNNVFKCVYKLTRNDLNTQILPAMNDVGEAYVIDQLGIYSPETKAYLKPYVKHLAKKKCVKDRLMDNGDKRSSDLELMKLPEKIISIPFNILVIQPFIRELQDSSFYRKNVYSNLRKVQTRHAIVDTNEKMPIMFEVFINDSYRIDYAWGMRLWRQIHLAIERECAAAWLSTLGGAFSALGEQSDKCAQMALKISLKQIKLSVDSGDPDGVARGWLFMALALSQLGHSDVAFHLLNKAYVAPAYDSRHKTMCMGVEVKLKYDKKIRRQRHAKGIFESEESLEKIFKKIL